MFKLICLMGILLLSVCNLLSGLIKMCEVSLLSLLTQKAALVNGSELFWGAEHQTTFCDPDVVFKQHSES